MTIPTSMMAITYLKILNLLHMAIRYFSCDASESNSRDTMLLCRDVWARRDGYSTAAVTLGVILETFEVGYALKRYVRKAIDRTFMRRITSKKEEPEWFAVVGAIGLLLVIGGVAGEWQFEEKLSGANAAIANFDHQQTLAADKRTGIALGRAAESLTSANAASTAASDALTKAISALSAASADELKTRKLALEATDLEISLAPRTIHVETMPDGSRNNASLLQFAGVEVKIECIPDAEAFSAASDLAIFLKRSGWVYIDPIVVVPMSEVGIGVKGVEVLGYGPMIPDADSKSWQASLELENVLDQSGWYTRIEEALSRSTNPNLVIIHVGFKPIPHFEPKSVRDERDSFRNFREDVFKNSKPINKHP